MFEDVEFPVKNWKRKERLQCQTLTKQGKRPCRAPGIRTKKGTVRCRIHGGWSTGPKTEAGKKRALQNLKQYDKSNSKERLDNRETTERQAVDTDLPR